MSVSQRKLGRTGLEVPAIGVGTNQWGRSDKDANALAPVYAAALDTGAALIDTAEVYQFGRSEKVIGECMRRDPRRTFVVSKFAPYPTRLSTRSIGRALEATLQRLGRSSVDLYLIHFPFTLLRIAAMMDALAECVRAGKVRAVGVSNFSADQMRRAADALARHQLPLAANEVHYNVFHRAPEHNGVLDACRALDVSLIAYRPIAGGLVRDRSGTARSAMERVANARGKSVAQVALNWLLCRDERILVIPGATSVGHLRENVEAGAWRLSDDEFAEIDRASRSQ